MTARLVAIDRADNAAVLSFGIGREVVDGTAEPLEGTAAPDPSIDR